jgi:hypothetical protein
MYEEPFYWVLYWFYDRVEERYAPVAAGLAQFALGLMMIAGLLAFIIYIIPKM